MAGAAIGRAAIFILRIAVGALFIYAGAVKIPDAPAFAVAIANYRLVSWDVAVIAAIYLPWLEVVAGAALIVRRLYRGALALLIGAMLVFIGAVGAAAGRGLDVSCGCFGAAVAPESYSMIILRDMGILCALLALAVAEWRKTGPRGTASGELNLKGLDVKRHTGDGTEFTSQTRDPD